MNSLVLFNRCSGEADADTAADYKFSLAESWLAWAG